MESKLIRIIPDQVGQSWGDWAAQGTHDFLKLNSKYSLFNKISDRITPSVEQIKTAGGIVADAANGLVGLVHKSDSDQIHDIQKSHASDIKDVEGHSLVIDTIYAEHPIIRDTFIKADALHTYILKEQRAQIIRYFRSAVALKSLIIEIVSQASGKFYAAGGWKSATVGGGKESHDDRRHWFTATYNQPTKETTIDGTTLFWMPYFDEILAATKDASGGSIETATVLNTSFGITADAAKIANIDANWIATQSFLVKAEYI